MPFHRLQHRGLQRLRAGASGVLADEGLDDGRDRTPGHVCRTRSVRPSVRMTNRSPAARPRGKRRTSGPRTSPAALATIVSSSIADCRRPITQDRQMAGDGELELRRCRRTGGPRRSRTCRASSSRTTPRSACSAAASSARRTRSCVCAELLAIPSAVRRRHRGRRRRPRTRSMPFDSTRSIRSPPTSPLGIEMPQNSKPDASRDGRHEQPMDVARQADLGVRAHVTQAFAAHEMRQQNEADNQRDRDD